MDQKLIELKRLIQSIQSSKLVNSDNINALVMGIKKLTDDMPEGVSKSIFPVLPDGRLPRKGNMEEFNEYKRHARLNKLERINLNLKKILSLCEQLDDEIPNEKDANLIYKNEDIRLLYELFENVNLSISLIASELDSHSKNEIASNEINEILSKYHRLESSFSKKQSDVIDSFRSRSEKEIDLFTDLGQKKLDSLLDNTQNRTKLLNSLAEKNNVRVSELSKRIETIESQYTEQIELASDIYKNGIINIEESKKEIESMLSNTANRVMADDYVSSAVAEKKAANWLRALSLVCMTIIVGIVCLSFYDSTHSGFDWESSIFRTVLVFILSIPAAYLSRESTKHREQQYNYHHTALDLKAITPYIASLPEADQNRIKISIAERIFASRQTNVAQQDSFPLNTQELVMELIRKVDFKKEDKKDTQVESAGK
ncbi:hypothetical protein MTF64_04755 [Pseudoalteromonas sp. 2CM41L]|uniref:hypothetical protein n=1 Tax=Pseudoalteromonas sp. 2CM41L TaxID=2929857 RepID=UPI0020BEA49F|nr:hypothetical protein [Pseudoalteromonas sp. 2CM41L]MCK8106181.1 hypothetical protein [Pseudoalteromonas sp. 2CM41L]